MRRLTNLHLEQQKERERRRKRMTQEVGAVLDRQFEDGIRALENIPDEEWQAAVEADAAEFGETGENAA